MLRKKDEAKLSQAKNFCTVCGTEKKTKDERCSCGSAKTTINLSLKDRVKISEPRFRAKVRGSSGFLKYDLKVIERLSGKLKNFVRNTIFIDRTNPKITKKYHRVDEYDKSGTIIDHHEHTNTFKAKRR